MASRSATYLDLGGSKLRTGRAALNLLLTRAHPVSGQLPDDEKYEPQEDEDETKKMAKTLRMMADKGWFGSLKHLIYVRRHPCSP